MVMLMVPFDSGLLPGLEGGVMVYHLEAGTSLELPSSMFESLPPGASITVVERRSGPWGGEITFEPVLPEDGSPVEIRAGITTPHRSDTSVSVPIGESGALLGYVELSAPVDYGINLMDQLKQALVTAGVGFDELAARSLIDHKGSVKACLDPHIEPTAHITTQ